MGQKGRVKYSWALRFIFKRQTEKTLGGDAAEKPASVAWGQFAYHYPQCISLKNVILFFHLGNRWLHRGAGWWAVWLKGLLIMWRGASVAAVNTRWRKYRAISDSSACQSRSNWNHGYLTSAWAQLCSHDKCVCDQHGQKEQDHLPDFTLDAKHWSCPVNTVLYTPPTFCTIHTFRSEWSHRVLCLRLIVLTLVAWTGL